MSSDSARFDST